MKVRAGILVVALVAGCLTPWERSRVADSDKYTQIMTAELLDLRRRAGENSEAKEQTDATKAEQARLDRLVKEAEARVKEAKDAQEVAHKEAERIKNARGIQIVESAESGLQTAKPLIPYGEFIIPVLSMILLGVKQIFAGKE